MIEEILNSNQFVAKRDVFAIGGAFRIMNPEGKLLLYSRQKLFKLKEDIRIYADREMTQELLHIQARQIIDFSAAYDVIDSRTQEKVGVLRRKGFQSLVRDKWEILDKADNYFARIEEESTALALIRRLILNIIPQNYHIVDTNEKRLGQIKQAFNLFIHRFYIDFSADTQKKLDRRLGLAAIILLLAIEGRQR